jgi:thiol:disulfide interchange protein
VARVTGMEIGAFFLFLAVGALPLISGGSFLEALFPASGAWMVLTLNMIIGLEVGAGITLILVRLMGREE